MLSIKIMSAKEFSSYFNKYKTNIFKDHSYALSDLLSKSEQSSIDKLKKNEGTLLRLRLGAFNSQNEFVGWSWGYQTDAHTFYMCNSAVLENFRQQKIYSQLLDKMLGLLREKGFQKIFSKHNATNNAIIIPKLKKGFIITSMEIDDIFGTLIHLTYYTNPVRKQIMDYRVGQIQPTCQIKNLFRI